jgi:hypothetical protein
MPGKTVRRRRAARAHALNIQVALVGREIRGRKRVRGRKKSTSTSASSSGRAPTAEASIGKIKGKRKEKRREERKEVAAKVACTRISIESLY